MSAHTTLIGQPLDRTDGIAKVTGHARFSAEQHPAGITHAVLVTSTISSGRVEAIDTDEAERMPGVLLVMTPRNAPRLPEGGKAGAGTPPAGRVLNLLQDDAVDYQNQPIALVVADTLEHARAAAAKVRPHYRRTRAVLDLDEARQHVHAPASVLGQDADTLRGDVAGGMRHAERRFAADYTTPPEHHNPMEPHATVAVWDGERLVLHDSTQYVSGVQGTVAKTLGIAPENVRVHCPFTGGGFGCKGSTWSHVVLAAMAAKQIGRPVKLVLDRPQMFGPVGGRPDTLQYVELAARSDGAFTAMRHDVVASTSRIEDWIEPSAIVTRMLYAVPNLATSHRLAPRNIGTPTFMRAPGEATGSFALESAIDELAWALNIDPIALRMKNDAARDPEDGRPWSSKSLEECYRLGAQRFGWDRRMAAPRSMRDGDTLIGMGMATATYPARRSKASARARLLPDGTARIESGSQDLGTGTYTVMTQVAAEALCLPPDKVQFSLGDTDLPRAPVSGGSQSAASVAPAVQAACTQVLAQAVRLAVADPVSPLHGAQGDTIAVRDGWLVSAETPQHREALATLLARHGKPLEATATVEPGDAAQHFAMHSFGAIFVEVHVDEALGEIRVPRVVGVYGVGTVLNRKTARSQLIGGIVGGLGMALMEKTEYDPRTGRIVNANLADYHVPVNADIGAIDITLLDEKEDKINPLGVKGIGEIGITGVAAAIANAVFHATGKRVRDLPITLDKLIEG